MILPILLWTFTVAAVWWFADAILGFLTPGAAWLQSNPELAAWIEPTMAFLGTLGAGAALITWLAGLVVILLIGRRSPVGREDRRARLPYEEWRRLDEGARPASRPGRRERYHAVADDDDDGYASRRRKPRRREDDDDDDDDEDD